MSRRLRILYREYVRPFFIENKAIIFLIWGVVTLILGYYGFAMAARAHASYLTPWDLLYKSAQLFTLGSGSDFITSPGQPWQLNLARYLALAYTLATISILALTAFYKQFNYFWLREITRNHVIVCGIGAVGTVIAKHLLEKGYSVVVIEKDPTNKELDSCWQNGAIVIVGDASEEHVLRKAQVSNARCLFVVTGTDQANAKIALLARTMKMAAGGTQSLNCFVHIVDPKLANFLKVEQMAAAQSSLFRLEFFNIYHSAAYCLQSTYPAFKKERHDPPDVHILVVGMGKMGESLVIQTAKQWREWYGGTGKRITITCIDRDADKRIEMLGIRFPSLARHCTLIPQTMELMSPEFHNGAFLSTNTGTGAISAMYICLSDESLGLSVALTLHQMAQNPDIPLVLRTVSNEGFARLFNDLNRNTLEFKSLMVFPMVSCDCCLDLIVRGMHEQIARAVHDEYIELQKREGLTPEGNPSMLPWKELPAELKESNRRQADHIWTKLEKIQCGIMLLTDWEEPLFQFTQEEIEFLAQEEHLRWMQEKQSAGYRWGSIRSSQEKTHPCIVPWDRLPEAEKEKDRNAVRSIPKILAIADLKIVRFGDYLENT